ncbi:MAG: CRISPR-associated protein Cas5 [Desulfotomaculum sp. 46_296]|nr:MAG: CRISPR-associated protein Cas5 [Desulfotomaculum sp. 46_296]
MTLVFEVASNIAMFRKGYTTTSMVSYPFIPPTAVAGMIAAIIGLDNGADKNPESAIYWNKLKGTQVAVSIRSPLLWYSTAVNLIKFKNKNGDMREHIQPKHQFIKNPCYRIFVRGGDMYKELKDRLIRNECIFTPYLGVAYAIAEVTYLGEFMEENVCEYPVLINTIVPVIDGLVIDIEKSRSVFKETVPLVQDADRSFVKSIHVLHSGQRGLGNICVKEKGKLELSKVGVDRVAWFEAW